MMKRFLLEKPPVDTILEPLLSLPMSLPTMSLSLEQEVALQHYNNGSNVFVTGPGGTGKTHLIREIYRAACNANKQIYVTALTGCAAVLLHCKATTLHSWAGIGLGAAPVEDLLTKIRKNKQTLARWKRTDVLVIDECSMLSQQLFEKLDFLAKKTRNNPFLPFGGIQLIMSGDFYQLPPIGNREECAFCFESDLWSL
jgi:ATP-dependent DNA helicase PIF1